MTQENSTTQAQLAADGPDPKAARRRLIRGAFTAPAALTLCSGGAFAAASTSQCVATQVGNPALSPPSPAVGPADAWLRVNVYQVTGSSPAQFWIKGSDVNALKGTKVISVYITPSEFQLTTAPFTKQVGAPANLSSTASTTSFALVRVDVNGNITGIAGFNTGSPPIQATCWSSFKNSA